MTQYDVILKLCGLVKSEKTMWDILDTAVDSALIGPVDAIEIRELVGLEPREKGVVAYFAETRYAQSVRRLYQEDDRD